MVILKLLGYALGSVVMYWGIVLFFVAAWLLGVILVMLVNQVWNKITGKYDEWKWFLDWFDAVGKLIHRFRIEWMGWIPGILIQIWYAGYAADLVHTSTLEASTGYAIAVNVAGVLGMGVAAAIFYVIYSYFVEVDLGHWVYGLVGGISLAAYIFLLQQPQTAGLLSTSWERVFAALFAGFIESLITP
jgi:hypothetical protein